MIEQQLLELIAEQSGHPTDDAMPAWLHHWVAHPVPALGGARPSELVDTPDGLEQVRRTLLRIVHGTYA